MLYSYDVILEKIFPEHFSKEQGIRISFLLMEALINSLVSFWFYILLFQLCSVMTSCQDGQLIDLMLLSFQPSKSPVDLSEFWPDALYSKMLSAILVVPWLCWECFKWSWEGENRESDLDMTRKIREKRAV